MGAREAEHALLGDWLDFGRVQRRVGEEVSGYGDQGPARPVRDEARQRPQGGCCSQHHVRCRAVPGLSAAALEVSQDSDQQAL